MKIKFPILQGRLVLSILVWGVLLGALALTASLMGGSLERTVVLFMIALTATVGMGIYCGNSGVLSFGHLSFMAMGAYASGLLTLSPSLKQTVLPHLPSFLAAAQWSLPAAMAAAVLLAVAVAWLSGLLIARLENSTATIATLGMLVIVHGLIVGARDLTRGSQSFFGVPRETSLLLAAAVAIATVVAARLFRDSVPGLRLRAARDDALAARSCGIHVERQRLLAWMLSAIPMAVAGVLLAHYLGTFSPARFYFTDTFLLLAMLIVGGTGSVTGAVAGAALVTLIGELLRHLENGIQLGPMQLPPLLGAAQIGIALAILLIMSRRREGLVGAREWDEHWLPHASTSQAAKPAAPAAAPAQTTHTGLLQAHGLTRRFGGLVAVDAVDLQVKQGEILGLIGPNGSGKSTMLSLLSGVLEPSAGEVRLDGTPLQGRPAQHFAVAGIARTFQNIRLFDSLDVRQNVLAAALHGWPRRHRAQAEAETEVLLAELGVEARADTPTSALSYGERRRVEIARALALAPRFLFLDEPAAGMNHEETQDLMQRLRSLCRQRALGIVIVDHDLPLIVGLCDRLAVLDQGRLIAKGPPLEVQRMPVVVEAYLGRRHPSPSHA